MILCHVQLGPHKVELNDMPDGASMKDCVFRAHDERFFDIIGDSPQIVRLAKKEHDFAHEVGVSVSRSIRALCVCVIVSPDRLHSQNCTLFYSAF